MHNTLTGVYEVLFWSVLGFVCGAVPYSLLLARAVSGIDVRTIGDGNPGSANAFRAAGWKAGAPALLLDFLKAAVPVAAASFAAGVNGWALVPVGLAPVAGHAFSPFLRWKGGKAIAATFGMWTGLTLWEGPVILGAFLTLLWALLDSDAWCPVIASAGLTAWLALAQHQAPLIVIGLLTTALLALKQGGALSTPPRLRRVSHQRTRRE
jgi:glycerol-3-phosphate acyltransferase PlsY